MAKVAAISVIGLEVIDEFIGLTQRLPLLDGQIIRPEPITSRLQPPQPKDALRPKGDVLGPFLVFLAVLTDLLEKLGVDGKATFLMLFVRTDITAVKGGDIRDQSWPWSPSPCSSSSTSSASAGTKKWSATPMGASSNRSTVTARQSSR